MNRPGGDVIGADGKVRVLARMCPTCIFRPGNRMHLAPGRRDEVVAANLAAEALLTCHATLPYGASPEFGPAVCAGFWARYGMSTLAGRIAAALIGVTRVTPPQRSLSEGGEGR